MLKAAEKIVWQQKPGMAVLLNVATGHYYTLNATGSALWKAMVVEHLSLEASIERLASDFESAPEPEVLAADCRALLEEWKAEHLVDETPDQA